MIKKICAIIILLASVNSFAFAQERKVERVNPLLEKMKKDGFFLKSNPAQRVYLKQNELTQNWEIVDSTGKKIRDIAPISINPAIGE